MNLPFSFNLNTSSNKYGRFLDHTVGNSGTTANQTLLSQQLVPSSPDGLGTTTAARLATLGTNPPTTAFYINGFSLTAWYSDGAINLKCDLGLYDTVNSLFVPLYECCSTGVPAGGIQKTFGQQESGLYVPWTLKNTLFPALRVSKLGADDGAVTVTGDLSLYVIQP